MPRKLLSLSVYGSDKDTRMNPNLEYAQMIPGHNGGKGRCYGLLDSYSFVEMLDAVKLLEQSKSFTAKDSKQLQAWFGKLLNWILTSPQGQEESRQANNHSVAYDAQVIAIALYTGNLKVAREVINAVPAKRIFTQIEPDGRQPHELRRTLAFGYSQYNLTHLIDILLMARRIGTHIDNATSPDGRNFYRLWISWRNMQEKASEEWPYQQISEWDYKQQEFCKDLYRAGLLNPARKDYLRLSKAHRVIQWKDRFNLLYVQPSEVDNAYAFACKQLEFAMQCADKAKKERRMLPGVASSRVASTRTVRWLWYIPTTGARASSPARCGRYMPIRMMITGVRLPSRGRGLLKRPSGTRVRTTSAL